MTALFEFDARDMNVAFQVIVADWLRTVGVDPDNVKNGHVTRGDAGYELHLTEMRRGADGQPVAIVENGRVVGMEPADRVVQLGDVADWPGAPE